MSGRRRLKHFGKKTYADVWRELLLCSLCLHHLQWRRSKKYRLLLYRGPPHIEGLLRKLGIDSHVWGPEAQGYFTPQKAKAIPGNKRKANASGYAQIFRIC